MSRALASCIEFREGRSDRFLDVDFRDVMADPFAEVRRIYEFAGLELADDALASMRQWAVDNSRDKREAHHYTLEEFGLTRAGIERDFATYREHFVKHA